MTPQNLSITKTMRMLHGRLRPFIDVKAEIAPKALAFLLEHFPNENLFKRTAYANGFSDGGLQASPPLTRTLSNFVRSDACPEITVKTLTSGQRYEATGLWDMLCFEFVAKRSFDALAELAECAKGFAETDYYFGFDVVPDMAAFEADTAAELAASGAEANAPAPAPEAPAPAPVADAA